MANRSIQQKILKMKRRGRHARFTGGQTKFVERIVDGKFAKDGKAVTIPVGPVSLSNQVISTGRGPDQECLQGYFERITAKSFMDRCDDDMGIKHQKYLQRYWDVQKMFRIVVVENDLGRLELYFSARIWFLVDVDYKTGVVKRSREYGNKHKAMTAVETSTVRWVEIHHPS